MISTFNKFQTYKFDSITLSETWLKDNHLLSAHVSIPGYYYEFRNRAQMKGGGVGAYIKDTIKYERRKDIEKRYPALEHLRIEISGKNKNSNLLLGTIYRSTNMLSTHLWFTEMENLLSDLSASWSGLLLLAGDFDIDLYVLQPTHPMTRQYLDLVYVFNLSQHIKQATRTTRESATLIDHTSSNRRL